MKRIEWNEIRNDELYCIIADETHLGFEFAERSTWDVRWYELAPTEDLIAKAKYLANRPENVTFQKQVHARQEYDYRSTVRISEKESQNRDQTGHEKTGRGARISTNHMHPWSSGSFYLFVLVIAVGIGLLVEERVRQIVVLPIILIFGPLCVCFIGGLQLRHDKRITGGQFLKLIVASLKSLPIFKNK